MSSLNIFKNNSRLARSFVIYMVLASTLIAIFTSAFQLYELYSKEKSGIELRLQEIEDSYSENIARRVWVANIEELTTSLEGILRLPDIEYIQVLENNYLLVEVGSKEDIARIERQYPLTYIFRNEVHQIGVMKITATLENVHNHVIEQALTIVLSNAIKTFIVSGFMLLIFYRLVGRHLHNIAEYAEELSVDNLGERLVLERKENLSKKKDEFDLVVDAFHKMQANLKNSISELSKSERNLSQTLASIGDAVIATDRHGRVVRMNAVAEQLTGWTFEKARNKRLDTVFDVINAFTRETIVNPVDLVLSSGKKVGLVNHSVLISLDGTEYQIADSAAPIIDEHEEIAGIILVFRDITEDYEMQEAIRVNEERLQGIMDNSPAVIYVKDIEGQYMMVNKEFEKRFDILSDDVKGKTTHDIFPAAIADEMVLNDQDVLHSRLPLYSEEKAPHEDGVHYYSSSKFCLFDSKGEPYAVCGISTDITEQRKQAELLRRSQKMEAVGNLTGGIAHDFNNLLNVIIGYSEILDRNLEENSANQSFAKEIRTAGHRGAVLTQKLLSFSGQVVVEKSTVDINGVLQEDLGMLKRAVTARVQVKMDLADGLWQVELDKSEFEDVILNLSINSMHAMPGGGTLTYVSRNETLSVLESDSIGLPGPGEYVRFSVIDTGVGIDKETQARVFEPFFTTKGHQGTGLGLSQVYGFMQRCNGTVTLHSDTGSGTEFALYFPRDTSADAEVSDEATESNSDIQLRGSETILLVDDEVALLDLGQNIFKQQGYKVFCAEGADSALWILSRNKVDVMISDIIMPGTDGYELAGKVEQLYPDVKIQLVSGYRGDRGLEEKDNPYTRTIIEKPYNIEQLLKRVRQLVDTETV